MQIEFKMDRDFGLKAFSLVNYTYHCEGETLEIHKNEEFNVVSQKDGFCWVHREDEEVLLSLPTEHLVLFCPQWFEEVEQDVHFVTLDENDEIESLSEVAIPDTGQIFSRKDNEYVEGNSNCSPVDEQNQMCPHSYDLQNEVSSEYSSNSSSLPDARKKPPVAVVSPFAVGPFRSDLTAEVDYNESKDILSSEVKKLLLLGKQDLIDHLVGQCVKKRTDLMHKIGRNIAPVPEQASSSSNAASATEEVKEGIAELPKTGTEMTQLTPECLNCPSAVDDLRKNYESQRIKYTLQSKKIFRPIEMPLMRLQFELMCEEAAYFKSLLLMETYIRTLRKHVVTGAFTDAEIQSVFAGLKVHDLKKFSFRFLRAMDTAWQDHNINFNILDIILCNTANENFHACENYMKNYLNAWENFNRLLETKPDFKSLVDVMLKRNGLEIKMNSHTLITPPFIRIKQMKSSILNILNVLDDVTDIEKCKAIQQNLDKVINMTKTPTTSTLEPTVVVLRSQSMRTAQKTSRSHKKGRVMKGLTKLLGVRNSQSTSQAESIQIKHQTWQA